MKSLTLVPPTSNGGPTDPTRNTCFHKPYAAWSLPLRDRQSV